MAGCLPLQKEDVLNHHADLMITFNNRSPPRTERLQQTGVTSNRRRQRHHNALVDCAEAIIYTPLGIESRDRKSIPRASPPIHTLAFSHGLHSIRVGKATGCTAL